MSSSSASLSLFPLGRKGKGLHGYSHLRAIRGIIVLPATWHKWTRSTLTPPSKLVLSYLPRRDGRLSWPRLPGNAPARSRTGIFRSQVRRSNHYTTETPCDTVIISLVLVIWLVGLFVHDARCDFVISWKLQARFSWNFLHRCWASVLVSLLTFQGSNVKFQGLNRHT